MPVFKRPQIADERFAERTGKSMAAWLRILDRWGAKAKGHAATARYLEHELGLDGWWAQAVTVQYEYARGLRKPLTVPAALRKALAASPGAKTAFDRLSLSHRREYVQWISEAKRPETRDRRIRETIARLTGKAQPANA